MIHRAKLGFFLYLLLDLLIGYGGFLPLTELSATGQNFPASVPQVVTQQLVMPVSSVNPQPVTGANVALSGNPGGQTYFYWIVATYPVGATSPAGPFSINNAPNTLSGSNFVNIFFTLPPGATSADVLRTKVNVAPSGACACAVATAQTVSPVADQSNTLNAYTVTPIDIGTLVLTLTNEVQPGGGSHLILRQNGVLINDLTSILSGGNLTVNTLTAQTVNSQAYQVNGIALASIHLSDSPDLVRYSLSGTFAQPQNFGTTWLANGTASGTITFQMPATPATASLNIPAITGADTLATLNLINTFTVKQNFAASTTSGASINLPSGTAPTTVVQGDQWFDSTLKGYVFGLATNVKGLPVMANPACQNVTPVTINTNSTAAQNLMSCTLTQQLYNSVLKTLHIWSAGYYNTSGTATAGTLIVNTSIGGTGNNICQATPGNYSASASNMPWTLDCYVTVQTGGASGKFESHGNYDITLGTTNTAPTNTYPVINTATVPAGTVDLTSSQTLQVTATFSTNQATPNSAQQRQLVVEIVD